MTSVTSELHPIPVNSPWYHISIDFVGPVTTSTRNNCFILSLSNYFTKCGEATALLFKCASGNTTNVFNVGVFITF